MFDRRKKQRREKERRREDMSALQKQIKELRHIVFTMLNFTNMYTLVLDEEMVIRFANNSLAHDLGLKDYNELVGKCWLDFIKEEDTKRVSMIHNSVAYGTDGWEVYKEVKNMIIGKNEIYVHWFNSHINSHYNWTFSFGVRKNKEIEEETDVPIDSVREYYHDIITKDRMMINSIRDLIGANKTIDTCKPSFT